MIRPPPTSTLFPYTTLFRSGGTVAAASAGPDQGSTFTLSLPLTANRAQQTGEFEQAELPHKLLRSEEHTSELQSLAYLVCRLLLEKKNKTYYHGSPTITQHR